MSYNSWDVLYSYMDPMFTEVHLRRLRHHKHYPQICVAYCVMRGLRMDVALQIAATYKAKRLVRAAMHPSAGEIYFRPEIIANRSEKWLSTVGGAYLVYNKCADLESFIEACGTMEPSYGTEVVMSPNFTWNILRKYPRLIADIDQTIKLTVESIRPDDWQLYIDHADRVNFSMSQALPADKIDAWAARFDVDFTELSPHSPNYIGLVNTPQKVLEWSIKNKEIRDDKCGVDLIWIYSKAEAGDVAAKKILSLIMRGEWGWGLYYRPDPTRLVLRSLPIHAIKTTIYFYSKDLAASRRKMYLNLLLSGFCRDIAANISEFAATNFIITAGLTDMFNMVQRPIKLSGNIANVIRRNPPPLMLN